MSITITISITRTYRTGHGTEIRDKRKINSHKDTLYIKLQSLYILGQQNKPPSITLGYGHSHSLFDISHHSLFIFLQLYEPNLLILFKQLSNTFRIVFQLATSRDDVGSSDSKAPPRFCSINPQTYRPTFAGGSYRTGATSSATSTAKKPDLVVGSRYLTSAKETAKPATTPEKKVPSKLESYLSKKNSTSASSSPSTSTINKYGSTKELPSADTKRTPTSKYSSSSTNNLTAIGSDSRATSQRNLTAVDADKTKSSKFLSNRDLTKDSSGDSIKSSRFTSRTATKPESTSSRYGSASKLSSDPKESTSRYGNQYSLGSGYSKRDAENKTKRSDGPPITYNTLYGRGAADKCRSRDPSPKVNRPTVTINRTRSRDPSPLKSSSREVSPIEQLKERYGGTSSGFTSASNSYTNRFRNAVSPFNQRPAAAASGSSNLLLSYMTNSEAAISRRFSPSKSKEPSAVDETLEEIKHLAEDIERVLKVEEEEVIMVQVEVVHRATSPNPASGTSNRTRRLDISKTITKTIERPLKKPLTVDKEIQSDRMDDSTKYSKFNPTSTRAVSSSWSPEVKKNSPSVIGKSRTESPAENKSDTTMVKPSSSPSSTSSSALAKSNSIKNLSRTDSKRSISRSDSTKRSSTSKSGKSSENGPKNLPPTGPIKAESPAKVIPNGVNKDFRKSALNMGPTDRLRKARGSQSSTDSSSSKSGIVCNHSRSDRSHSVGSEIGSTCSSVPSSANGTPTPQRAKSQSKVTRLSESKSLKVCSSMDELPIDNLSDICSTVTHQFNLSRAAPILVVDAPPSVGHSLNESGAKNENSQRNVAELNAVRRSPSQLESSPTSSSTEPGLSTVAKIFYRSVSPQQRPHPLPAAAAASSEPRDLTDLEPNTEATSIRNRCDSTSVSESLRLDTEQPHTNMGVRECSELSSERSWFDKANSDQPLELKAEMLNRIRHIDSGDRSTWLASKSSKSGDTRHSNGVPEVNIVGGEENGCENSNTNTSAYKIRHIESGESAWWMSPTNGGRDSPSGSASSADKTSRPVDEGVSEERASNELLNASRFTIKHVQSGEKAWWMSPTPEVQSSPVNGSDAKFKLRHNESGEKAWWMKSESEAAIVNGVQTNNIRNSNSVTRLSDEPKSKFIIRPIESGERAWWLDSSDDVAGKRGASVNNKTEDDISEVEEDEEFDQIIIDGTLGDRASPEGVEDPSMVSQNRRSPYENVQQHQQKNLFISKHTNIDDVLGSSQLQQARYNSIQLIDQFLVAYRHETVITQTVILGY